MLTGLKPAGEPPESGRLLAARSAGSSVAWVFFALATAAWWAESRRRCAFSSAAARARASGGKGGTQSLVMGLSFLGPVPIKDDLNDSDDTGVSSAMLLSVRFVGAAGAADGDKKNFTGIHSTGFR